MKKIATYKIFWIAVLAVIVLSARVPALALDVSHYAAHSVLAEGKWQKIKVNATGIHLITTSELKSMGFSDPSKVNVYGTGGRKVREALTSDMADDLPLLPCVRTSRGILFYATDNVSWSLTGNGMANHELNPYSDDSYYFLSDREPVADEEQTMTASPGKGVVTIKNGYSKTVHERDLQAPSTYGRLLLGEDFRTNKSQTFNLSLPGHTDGQITATVSFGARVINGTSSVLVSVNGTRLPATTSNQISGANDSEFIKVATFSQDIDIEGEKLPLTLEYSYSGALFTARLDYIRVVYARTLDLSKESEVDFFYDFNGSTGVEISGCDAETKVWDVTDPVRPIEVDLLIEGGKGYFLPEEGIREFVAFNPAKAGATVERAGSVTNQDIHGMPSPQMLIVAYKEYAAAAERLARMHEQVDGMTVAVLTPESIYNEFSGGVPDVGAFRKLLKMWYDRNEESRIRYCLLMGRGSYDTKMVSSGIKAAGYRPLPLWQSPTGVTEVTAYSTDNIIGMLDDTDEKGFDISSAQMHVAVGRLPIKTQLEAENMVAKIEKYVTQPVYGNWRNRVMLIADDNDNAIHLMQTEDVYNKLHEIAPDYKYERLYLDSYPLEYTSVGKSYPKAKERMLRLWNEGVAFTNYVGHASSSSWTHEKLLTWKDIISFSNSNLTFLYAATCLFAEWDADAISGAEEVVLNPDAGMVGLIAPSRTVYMTQNGKLNLCMADWLLTTDSNGGGAMRVGDVFVEGMNSYRDDNKLRYCLMSDPAIRIPKPTNRVEIQTIDGIDLLSAEDYPELHAQSKVKVAGVVLNPDGAEATDFNGTLILDLYDAERVVETYGNQENGVKIFYNDHTSRLSTVSTKVVEGKWEVMVNLPKEIDNNYTPARIVAYAYDGKGAEAQGSCEQLYVYGYEEREDDDNEGPKIEAFYLNYPDFRAGSTVHANPVVHARFSDESGINLSESSVGHGLSLTLDNDHIYSDVNAYYTPDPEIEGGGYITYPMSDLTPGEHTITLSVYDNANNATKMTLEFNVGTSMDPVIRSLYTDVNPASTSVVFMLSIDRPNTKIECMIEVFDLMGRRVWSSEETISSGMTGDIQTRWNLCDLAGRRVPRGIYLYRATVKTPEGMYSSKSKKLAVTAQ